MSKLNFVNRITDVWDYPKISSHNSKAIDDEYFSFLNETTEEKEVRLYIHTPFCNSFCYFCQFYKEAYKPNDEFLDNYLKCVIAEMDKYCDKEYFKSVKLNSIYFGGGDPALMPVSYLEKIIAAAKEKFNLADKVEITIEGNVLSFLKDNQIDKIKELGVDRISFGVQTLKESLRKRLLLKPQLSDIDNLVNKLNGTGYPSYTIDMMYNFPDEDYDDLERDLEKIIKYKSDYIDLYSLNLYPNTSFYDAIYNKKSFSIIPTKEREQKMQSLINDFFDKNEYNQVLSVTYSKERHIPNRAINHYVHGGEMLGIGPSARSFLLDRNFRNICSVEEYMKMIQNNQMPVEAGNILTPRDMDIRNLVFFPTLLKAKYDDVVKYEDSKKKIEKLVESGYLILQDKDILVTRKGRDWIGNIQKYLYDSCHSNSEMKALLESVKKHESAYNQDHMWVKGEK